MPTGLVLALPPTGWKPYAMCAGAAMPAAPPPPPLLGPEPCMRAAGAEPAGCRSSPMKAACAAAMPLGMRMMPPLAAAHTLNHHGRPPTQPRHRSLATRR